MAPSYSPSADGITNNKTNMERKILHVQSNPIVDIHLKETKTDVRDEDERKLEPEGQRCLRRYVEPNPGG